MKPAGKNRGAKVVAQTRAPVSPELLPVVWPGRREARLVLGLGLMALAAYSNSFRSGFVFDNRLVILNDPRMKTATLDSVSRIFSEPSYFNGSVIHTYRPLTTLSFWWNYAVLGNGDHSAAYHWINFSLHAFNIALVYLLAWLVMEKLAAAFEIAALWALHPLATESVTNLIGRADLLAAFGVLAGLLCHVQAAAASGWRKFGWLGGLAAVTAIGVFSKESAAIVLVVMAIYDITFRHKASWLVRAPGYAAAALPLLVYAYVRGEVLAKVPLARVAFVDNPLLGADFWTAQLTALKILGKYLWLLLWPARLSCDYSYNQIQLVDWGFRRWEDWQALAAVLVCAGAAAVAAGSYRRNKSLFFWIVLCLAILAPASSLASPVPVPTIMAERLTYLPAIGFAGCLVAALHVIGRSLPGGARASQIAVAVVCVAFAGRTFARNFDWASEETLWESAVRAAPASFKTHMNRAFAWLNRAALDNSIAEVGRGLAILDPLPDLKNLSASYMNAGTIYRRKGDAVSEKKPDSTPVPNAESNRWYSKSLEVLLRARRIEMAQEEMYRREDLARGVTRPVMGWYELYLELGRTYMRLGEPQRALEAYEYGRKLRTTPEFFAEMAAAWRAAGDPRKSAIALLEGLLFDPSQKSFAAGLAELYEQIDPRGCAVRNAGGARSINFECPLVHADICTASSNLFRLHRNKNQAQAAEQTRQIGIRELSCPAEMYR